MRHRDNVRRKYSFVSSTCSWNFLLDFIRSLADFCIWWAVWWWRKFWFSGIAICDRDQVSILANLQDTASVFILLRCHCLITPFKFHFRYKLSQQNNTTSRHALLLRELVESCTEVAVRTTSVCQNSIVLGRWTAVIQNLGGHILCACYIKT